MKEWWKKFNNWLNKNKQIIAIMVLITCFMSPFTKSYFNTPDLEKIQYSDFVQMVEQNKVKEVHIDLTASSFIFLDTNGVLYRTENPKKNNFKEELLTKGIEVKEIDPRGREVFQQFLNSIFNTIFFIVLLIVIMNWIQNRMGRNQKMEVSHENMPKVTFAQIAGNEEIKQEMQELVEFLKNPKKFRKMGAKLPKGVIFYGPPGTGKTLTAKAIAGEAGVSFFSASGSDFVEMYVGLGAKRVRELFAEARKKSPAIIFIDEIDAIGGNRNHDSHTEQRQTLNAILKEMDGFDSTEGIIVIGATNRLEDLDPAFIRPGRFDKHIAINLPDQKERLQILKVHAKNKPLAPDVDLESLSKLTIGLSGASLEAILNEAAILATVRKHELITKEDIDDAYFKMVMKGHKKKSGEKRDEEELKLVAWHEAGHALAAKLLTNNEVPKVTIIPSTSGVGGVTFFIPKKMGLYSKEEILNEIKVLYAGRIAEYLLHGDENKITTGASQDIRIATNKIKEMINEYGMNEHFGMLNIEILCNSPRFPLNNNEAFVREAISLSKKLYNETYLLLKQHQDVLQAIAEELLKKETLVEEELNQIISKKREGKKES